MEALSLCYIKESLYPSGKKSLKVNSQHVNFSS